MGKAREFWILKHPESGHPDKATHIVHHTKHEHKDYIHVIEYKAYQEALLEIHRLKRPLAGGSQNEVKDE